MDSQIVVKSLLEVDPDFQEFCKAILGDSAEPADVWEFLYSPDRVVKMNPDVADLHVPTTTGRDVMVDTPRKGGVKAGVKRLKSKKAALIATGTIAVPGAVLGAIAGGAKKGNDDVEVRYLTKAAEEEEDMHEVVWSGEISKVDEEKRQVFGYASVTTIDGQPVVDRQGDMMDISDIEDAAYQYVMKSRVGGSQHRRDGDQPFHAMDLIESFVITPEKIEKMGLPEDTPLGWWTGFGVRDEETWQDYKSGKKTGFSIHGKGKRVPVDA
jgi:hypothetical protein